MTIFRRVAAPSDSSSAPVGEAPGYRLTARFGRTDAMVLRELAGQVVELVDAGSGTGSDTYPGSAGGPGPVGGRGSAGGAGGLGGSDVAGAGGSGGADPGGADLGGADLGGADVGSLGDLEDALGLSGNVEPPDDPALARLLPDAYRDDPQAASEFRRYTDKDLRAGKVAAAKTVLATVPEHGGRVILSAEEGETWLRALNDIRLALGVRLGITEELSEQMADLGPRDPRYGVFAVYDWLTAMQDSLVRAMS